MRENMLVCIDKNGVFYLLVHLKNHSRPRYMKLGACTDQLVKIISKNYRNDWRWFIMVLSHRNILLDWLIAPHPLRRCLNIVSRLYWCQRQTFSLIFVSKSTSAMTPWSLLVIWDYLKDRQNLPACNKRLSQRQREPTSHNEYFGGADGDHVVFFSLMRHHHAFHCLAPHVVYGVIHPETTVRP